MQFELQAAWQEAHALVDKDVTELFHIRTAPIQPAPGRDRHLQNKQQSISGSGHCKGVAQNMGANLHPCRIDGSLRFGTGRVEAEGLIQPR